MELLPDLASLTDADLKKLIADLMQELPQVIDRLSKTFPRAAPALHSIQSESKETRDWFARGLIAGKLALEAVSALVFVLVVAIYLVVEGRRAFAWLISFAPQRLRGRVAQTAEEVRVVMLSYVRGSVITETTPAALPSLVCGLNSGRTSVLPTKTPGVCSAIVL